LKTKSNHWRRHLTPQQRKVLLDDHKDILQISRGGILTTKQRQRLLGLKKQTADYDERKFWSDIRNSVKTTFTDLQLIMRIASDAQLSEMFESEYTESYPDRKIKHTRVEMMKFLDTLFREFENKSEPFWQDKLARQTIEKGVYYFRSKKEFKGTLYQRLFEDIIDAVYVNSPRDSTLSGMA